MVEHGGTIAAARRSRRSAADAVRRRARPRRAARSATPASPPPATGRWRRPARRRASARRPRRGSRRGAAVAADRWCSRRSCSRRRPGSARRRARRRAPDRGTAPRSSTTWSAVVGLTRPKRFADGAAIARCDRRSSSSVSGWAGARRPTVSRPPVTTSGTRADRGSSSVSGPGQHAAASTSAAGGTSAAQSSSHSGDDVHDQRVTGRAVLDLEDAGDGVVVLGVGAEPVHGLGRDRHQPAGARAARPRRRHRVVDDAHAGRRRGTPTRRR